MNLDHLSLRVRDAAACRDFYERHLGFAPAFEADRGYFVRNDAGFLLGLVPTESHQPLPDGVHVGFGLDRPEDVEALHRELSSAGVRTTPIDDGRPDDLSLTFRCWDPDGTEIEIFWHPA